MGGILFYVSATHCNTKRAADRGIVHRLTTTTPPDIGRRMATVSPLSDGEGTAS